ncbi:hypothetical protein [Neptuniibacter sp. QD37_11]|uniref:hypothetical protein n=1 Tax=Neptuniibacter sp. QD37_11 TaxID=3398209 RepID=UPI0039F4B0D9
MSTPATIRFLNKRGEAFSGVYIHYDCDLGFLIDSILDASKHIIPFPIRCLGSDKRIRVRSECASNLGCEESDLKFAYGIDKYAIAFTAALYNRFDIYEDHKSQITVKIGGSEYKSKPEFYSGTEDFISQLDLNSNYKGNIVYLVDISFPNKSEFSLDYEPVIAITTGVGDTVFKGSLSKLKSESKNLLHP